MRRSGFTLLEVVIALAILTVSLFVLIEAQQGAVISTVEAQRTMTGTWLAQEKMAEAMLRVERDGFTSADIDEEGDFSELASDLGERGGDDLDFGDAYEGYRWAYTIRQVDIQLGDIGGASESLDQAGFGGSTEAKEAREQAGQEQPETRDLGDLVQPDQISEMLRPFIREVRVVVWWSDDEPDDEDGCVDCVELVSHVVNPSGAETTLEGDGQGDTEK